MKPGAYGIITKGLGLPAGKGLIVNHFQLGPFIIDVTPPQPPVIVSGGGGSHPYAPGAFSDSILSPTTTLSTLPKRFTSVNITINVGSNPIVRSYNVTPRKGQILISTLQVVSRAAGAVSVAIGTIATHKFVAPIVSGIGDTYTKIKITLGKD